jgi:hypothetical protein
VHGTDLICFHYYAVLVCNEYSFFTRDYSSISWFLLNCKMNVLNDRCMKSTVSTIKWFVGGRADWFWIYAGNACACLLPIQLIVFLCVVTRCYCAHKAKAKWGQSYAFRSQGKGARLELAQAYCGWCHQWDKLQKVIMYMRVHCGQKVCMCGEVVPPCTAKTCQTSYLIIRQPVKYVNMFTCLQWTLHSALALDH